MGLPEYTSETPIHFMFPLRNASFCAFTPFLNSINSLSCLVSHSGYSVPSFCLNRIFRENIAFDTPLLYFLRLSTNDCGASIRRSKAIMKSAIFRCSLRFCGNRSDYFHNQSKHHAALWPGLSAFHHQYRQDLPYQEAYLLTLLLVLLC